MKTTNREGEMGMKSKNNGNNENIHAGHRQRLRESFLRGGAEGMADHVLLELLLTYAIPRADVNPLAHRLLRTFGSLSGVFQASPEALKNVDGMGENSVVFIKAMVACGQRCLRQYYANEKRLDLRNLEDASRFALSEAMEDRYETLRIICLDSKYHLINTRIIDEGNTVSVPADPRRIIETALQSKAHAFILSHNHPSGDIRPSEADAAVAIQIRDAANAIGMEVIDQLILGHGAVYSFHHDLVAVFSSPTTCYSMPLEEYAALRSGLPYNDDRFGWDSGFYPEE